jgi:hypothetical protein
MPGSGFPAGYIRSGFTPLLKGIGLLPMNLLMVVQSCWEAMLLARLLVWVQSE